LFPYILFEKYIYMLALKMARQGTSTVPIVSAHYRSLWVMTIGRRGLKVKFTVSDKVSKHGNAVGLISILRRGQFAF